MDKLTRISEYYGLGAILYYYLYKRTVLHLSDPKYRFDSEWLWEKIRQRSWTHTEPILEDANVADRGRQNLALTHPLVGRIDGNQSSQLELLKNFLVIRN